MAKKKKQRIVTPEGRLAFEYLLEKQPPIKPTDAPKYAAKLLLSRDTDLSKIKKIIIDAAREKFGDEFKSMDLNYPLKDNLKVKKDWNGFDDNFYITASTKFMPGLFGNVIDPETSGPVSYYDKSGAPKMPPVHGFGERGMFYSGCRVKMEISAWAYDTTGNRGVAFNLHAVQFIRDDEALGGSGVTAPAPEGFDAEYDGADDPSNYESSAAESDDDIDF